MTFPRPTAPYLHRQAAQGEGGVSGRDRMCFPDQQCLTFAGKQLEEKEECGDVRGHDHMSSPD